MTQDSESVPTPEMLDRFVSRALCVSVHGDGGWSNYAREQWSAMIAAAPSVREEVRNEVKRLISEHVSACLRMSTGGVIPTPLHPGPTADAIIAALSAAPSTSVREEVAGALERAAKVADVEERSGIDAFREERTADMRAYRRGRAEAGQCIALAIRALVPSTDEGKRHG